MMIRAEARTVYTFIKSEKVHVKVNRAKKLAKIYSIIETTTLLSFCSNIIVFATVPLKV